MPEQEIDPEELEKKMVMVVLLVSEDGHLYTAKLEPDTGKRIWEKKSVRKYRMIASEQFVRNTSQEIHDINVDLRWLPFLTDTVYTETVFNNDDQNKDWRNPN